MPTQIRIAAATAACLTVLLAAGPAAAHQRPHASTPTASTSATAYQLSVAKRATARFRDVRVAENAGYVAAGPCVAEPGQGGMGFHYEHPALANDPRIDISKPEVLVYAPTRKGGLRLVALEYLRFDADQELSTDADRPHRFGQGFDGPMEGHAPGQPIHYDLHVWLFKHNAAGLFAPFNPRVSC